MTFRTFAFVTVIDTCKRIAQRASDENDAASKIERTVIVSVSSVQVAYRQIVTFHTINSICFNLKLFRKKK